MLELFEIDPSVLIAGFVFGIIGWWMYREGRRRENLHTTLLGVGLMIYPYFVDNARWTWGIGFALCGAAYFLW